MGSLAERPGGADDSYPYHHIVLMRFAVLSERAKSPLGQPRPSKGNAQRVRFAFVSSQNGQLANAQNGPRADIRPMKWKVPPRTICNPTRRSQMLSWSRWRSIRQRCRNHRHTARSRSCRPQGFQPHAIVHRQPAQRLTTMIDVAKAAGTTHMECVAV